MRCRWATATLLGASLLLVPSSLVRPDALVITMAMKASTIAQVSIEEDSILVEMEIGANDLQGFANLFPDELYERLGNQPEPFAERYRRFFFEDFTLRPDGGLPLIGRVVGFEARRRVIRDQITGEPLPVVDDEAEPVIFITIVYPLAGHPESLTLKPPSNAGGSPTANIGFVAFHRSLPVNDFRYLSQAERLRLDWDDPWYSQFENRNLRRQFYAPISAFLYVEPYEVRKEIVARPKDLQQWVDLGLDGKDIITVDDQEEIKRKVADFLAAKNPLTIDGRPVEGTLDRIHFIYRNLRTSGIIDPARDLEAVSATLGIIFSYPVEGLPDEVSMEWELFTPRMDRVPSSATDEAGGLPYILSPDDNVLTWRNFLQNPTIPGRLVEVETPASSGSRLLMLVAIVGIVGFWLLLVRYRKALIRGEQPTRLVAIGGASLAAIAGVGLVLAVGSKSIRADDSARISEALLQNIYKSFDFRDEEQIYDMLSRTAAGDLLTDIYLETRRSLELENQGGARVKVKEVEVLSSDPSPLDDGAGFTTLLTWNVSGSVGHWGHIHTRRNQYEARLTVREIEGAWKVTGVQLLQETRL
jgi:hypothetical protein